MRLPALDARLRAACDLVPACDRAADIGADHGRLSCALLGEGRVKHMIVSDISAPSLEKARRLIALHGMEERAFFCLADGLAALSDDVQAVCILGMGGRTAADMLLRGRERLCGAALVLSAHSECADLRAAVCDIGYAFDREVIVRAGGRLYVVMRALPGAARYSPMELELGPCLLRDRPLLFADYIHQRESVYRCMREDGPRMLQWTRCALAGECPPQGGESHDENSDGARHIRVD